MILYYIILYIIYNIYILYTYIYIIIYAHIKYKVSVCVYIWLHIVYADTCKNTARTYIYTNQTIPYHWVRGSLRALESGSLRAPENHTFGVTLGDTGLGHGVRHSNLIIFLAVLQAQALHCSFMISYRWGGVGWGNNVHVPVHTQARRSCYVVTSSSSDLQDVPDTL